MRRFLTGLLFWLWSIPAMAGVTCSVPFNLMNGTTADATQVMANYNAILACFGNVASAGANTDITSLLGLTTPLAPGAGGTNVFIGGTSTGSANAQVVGTTTPNSFQLTVGYRVIFIPGYTNTGATQINVHSTGLTNLFRPTPAGAVALTGGELTTGQYAEAIYDGTQFELMTVANQSGGMGTSTTIASASTTDLSLAPNHNAIVSGTTTITSFGANANANLPIYRVTFSGALIITYNQTNCSTTGGCILTPGNGNITTAANDTAVLAYLGAGSGGGGNWQVISYQKQTGAPVIAISPIPGAFKNLSIKVASTTTVTVAADFVTTTNGSNTQTTAVSCTINLGTTGAINELDTGTIAIDTWYGIWVLAKSDGTTGCVASASFSSPTLVTGYTFQARVGAVQTIHASATLYGTWQFGREAQYVLGLASTSALPNVYTGSAGSITVPTWIASTVARAVPPTASVIKLAMSGSTGVAILAPNNSYGAVGSTTIPPPCGLTAAGTTATNACSLVLESTNVYFAANASNPGLWALGWVDNL